MAATTAKFIKGTKEKASLSCSRAAVLVAACFASEQARWVTYMMDFLTIDPKHCHHHPIKNVF